MNKENVTIIGGGFIGKPLAIALKKLGINVQVILKTTKRVDDFEQLNIPTQIASVGESQIFEDEFNTNVLFVAYPLGARSGNSSDYTRHVEWLRCQFPSLQLTQVILLSSTSVYPDGFGLMDENNLIRPTDYGLIQLEFEEALFNLYNNKLTVFRLAGLIGAERLPGRFLAGRKDLPNPDSPVNMVHQEDVLRFLLAAVSKNVTGEIFNLCHDKHPTRSTYYNSEARHLGLEVPEFSNLQVPNPKVIDNTKSKQFFGLNYLHDIES